jgi:hypothetical protein
MRRRVVITVLIAVVVIAITAVAFATTRHHDARCRGSYTYGNGGGQCNDAAAPSGVGISAQPVLGRSWGVAPQYQHGYGEVRPTQIDNGGDPTGLVDNVQWRS